MMIVMVFKSRPPCSRQESLNAMDSDESRDASSGSESEHGSGAAASPASSSASRASSGERSPALTRRNVNAMGSHSRSSSSGGSDSKSSIQERDNGGPRSPSGSPQLSPQSPQSGSAKSSPAPERRTVISSSLAPNRSHSSGSDSSLDREINACKNDKSDESVKSAASPKSKCSEKSNLSSRGSRTRARRKEPNTSDSSDSGSDSSNRRKNREMARNKLNTQPEEISDGDIELSDQDKPDTKPEEPKKNLNIPHEDLSDVSDLEDSIGDHSNADSIKSTEKSKVETDAKPVNGDSTNKKVAERSNEDCEEQLDFEAEDGECPEPEGSKEDGEAGEVDEKNKKSLKEAEELEEGELTDEDEPRPEETEPRPVCRFFSRGQCTWGASCRFLHPGVTDKGHYTMFEMIRPVVPGEYGGERMMYGGRVAEPPLVESAWERGLRTAKEMMRKSIKRKEQDIDFEEKKMNLSLAQEELDKENGYYTRAASPEPRYVMRHPPVEYPARHPPEEYGYGRRQVIYDAPEYASIPPRERMRPYREMPPQPQRHPPEHYPKFEEEHPAVVAKVRRPKREVIVQRVEERERDRAIPRGDEWSDPWMRSKSPAGRKGTRRRSYSSGSSYSSSRCQKVPNKKRPISSRSSSASSRSSYHSQSRTKKRTTPKTFKRVSPSVIVSERKAANERAALMNPPAPRKKTTSPSMTRLIAQNPPAPAKVDQFGRNRSKLAVAAALAARVKGRARSSRSSSESSSGSSSSDSDSSGSSSSSSREATPVSRRPTSVDLAIALKAKAIDALKAGSEKRQIKLNLKNAVSTKKEPVEIVRKPEPVPSSRKRPAASPPAADGKASTTKKASSRREELLKQLKAVEDAIAKKRSKAN